MVRVVTRESCSTSAPPIAFPSSGTIMEPGHLASCYHDSGEKSLVMSFQAIGHGIGEKNVWLVVSSDFDCLKSQQSAKLIFQLFFWQQINKYLKTI